MEAIIGSLPYGRRVVETIDFPEKSRLWFVNHMVTEHASGDASRKQTMTIM